MWFTLWLSKKLLASLFLNISSITILLFLAFSPPTFCSNEFQQKCQNFTSQQKLICHNLENNAFYSHPPLNEEILILKCENCFLNNTIFMFNNVLEKIDFSNSNIEKLNENLLNNFAFITNLNLTNSKIKEIDKNAFKTNRKLKEIDLSNNLLRNLNFAIGHLKKLEKLNLAGNQLEEEFNLSNYSLRHLNLSSNLLKKFHENHKILMLEILDLSHNKIVFFNATFSNLLLLNLSHNLIETLPQYSLSGGALKVLDLSHNSLLKNIEVKAFFHLPNLLKLNLSHCHLTILQKGVFHNLNNLKFLDLSGNYLSTFSTNVYSSLPQIFLLNLSSNKLENIEFSNSKKSLQFLKYLDLSFNPNLSNVSLNILSLNFTPNAQIIIYNNNLTLPEEEEAEETEEEEETEDLLAIELNKCKFRDKNEEKLLRKVESSYFLVEICVSLFLVLFLFMFILLLIFYVRRRNNKTSKDINTNKKRKKKRKKQKNFGGAAFVVVPSSVPANNSTSTHQSTSLLQETSC